MNYCASRFISKRRLSREVMVGRIGVGGNNPIRVQSMTTTDTCDVEATLKQAIALAEAGCEIIRITAPNKPAARALQEIRKKLSEHGFPNPLVADIHFLPQVAMEAVEHVEKVRINPGNYADSKRFKILEYNDQQYQEELERLHDAFSPIVLRCKALGKAMRIGTNHGSLSDRIMNRYGDSPLGMVESALEFIRISESHGFHNIVLSMKASNPKVMVEAYRLVVARMNQENMNYPLHLGVTEAGEGEDARIKSSIGIGSLLYDGLGDTLRVSLTEDPIYEIPVAQALAKKAEWLWQSQENAVLSEPTSDNINAFSYQRHSTRTLTINPNFAIGGKEVTRVAIPATTAIENHKKIIKSVCDTHRTLREIKIEVLILSLEKEADFSYLETIVRTLHPAIPGFLLKISSTISCDLLEKNLPSLKTGWILFPETISHQWFLLADRIQAKLVVPFSLDRVACLQKYPDFCLVTNDPDNSLVTAYHPIGCYRSLVDQLKKFAINAPIWIRVTEASSIDCQNYFSDHLMESSLFVGPLLCDGIGDIISIELTERMDQATVLAYNLLQGARTRIIKTEYVACPSCGRTLFDLQTTTRKIKARTDHLKGVTIAVMGCIVNGPGEMADADFGYVGGAPRKINLYVGKKPVKYNIPEDQAVDELINLIRENGKWQEAPIVS